MSDASRTVSRSSRNAAGNAGKGTEHAGPQAELDALAARGEQLTHLLLERWCAEL